MKLVVQFSLAIPLLVSCSCATLKDYKASHNQFLEDSAKKLNEPANKEQIKSTYFLMTPNPYEAGLLIDSFGTSAFDFMQCKVDKFNSRYPSSGVGNFNFKSYCEEVGGNK